MSDMHRDAAAALQEYLRGNPTARALESELAHFEERAMVIEAEHLLGEAGPG